MRAQLFLVTDRKAVKAAGGLLKAVRDAVKGGVEAVVLREKDINGTRDLLTLANSVKRAAGKALFFVNGRPDVALAAKACGVHLAAGTLTAELLKKHFGKNFIAGKSCHSAKDAEKAELEGADYIFLGPVFFTKAKAKYGNPIGLNELKKAVKLVKIPVIAIGGIKPENVSKVLAYGASGVAVISGILGDEAPGKAAEKYKKAIDGFRRKRIHKRVKVNIPAEIVDVLNDQRGVGKVTDISAGGVSMLVTIDVPISAAIAVTFEIQGEKFKNIAGDVVRSRKKGDFWDIGVAFFQPDAFLREKLERIIRHIYSVKERGMQKGLL